MSTFSPYPKMPLSMDTWALGDAEIRQAAKMTWVATEKVHGAHLCVTLTSDAIQVGKRRRALEPEEEFFAYPRALGPHYAALRRLLKLVRVQDEAATVVVYGEIFGGAYPHAQVEAVDGVHPVQTGVYYAPDVHFVAFDVGLVAPDGAITMLAFCRAAALLEQAGVPTVPVCATGTLAEMLALPMRFESLVPGQLGLPPLPDNWAEGLVLKPYSDGPLAAMAGRPLLLKRKPAAFEASDYHQAMPWPLAPGDAVGALEQAEALLLAAMDAGRVQSAISKIGRPNTAALRAELAAELVDDVRDSLECEHGAVLVSLSPEELALLWAVAHDAAVAAAAKHAAPRWLDDSRFMVDLLSAFIRGRLPEVAGGTREAAVDRAVEAGLSLHKFKRKSGPPRITTVLSILEGLRPESLLDIGSGRGAFLWPLLDRFGDLNVTAVDMLEDRVRDIQALRAGGVARLEGVLADTQALPFGDGAFDVVTILEVLEHLDGPGAAAQEVVRVAKHFVVASVPSQPDDNPEHIRLFDVASLTALFEEAGAERVQVQHVRGHLIAVIRCAQ